MKMHETSSRLQALQSLAIGSLPIVVYSASVDGQFAGPRYVNECLAIASGFDADAFVRDESLWSSRIHPEDLPRVSSFFGSPTAGRTLLFDYRWLCADGSIKRFLDFGMIESGNAGALIVRGICLDVTAVDSQSSQISSPVDLAVVAHELNNMVSVIVWNLEPLARSLRDTGKSFDRTQYALRAAARCVELIRRLLHPPAPA